MSQVSIIGGGNVGTNTAFFIAENRTAAVTLVDVKEGITTGKALDLMEAGPLRGYSTAISGSDSIEDIRGSHVVLIAAGRVRRPGEHRIDLYRDNAKTVRELCEGIKKFAPGAIVVNLVEPVDLLTLLAWKTLGCERSRVMGVGGLLSSTRLRYLVSNALEISPREVTALVVGPHHQSMVFLKDSIRVSGVPAMKLMDPKKLDELIEDARNAGDTIIDLAQKSSSYYGPSAAAAGLVDALVRNTHATLPISTVCQGEYGIDDSCIGVLARIGNVGIEKIIEIRMNAEEGEAFRRAAAELKAAWEQICREDSVA